MRETWLLAVCAVTLASRASAETALPACADCATPIPLLTKRFSIDRSMRRATGWDYRDLFPAARSGPFTGPVSRRSKALAFGDSGFSLRSERLLAARDRPGSPKGAPRDKLSTMTLGLHYALPATASDRMAFAFDGGVERRRFASDLTQGRWSTTRAVGLRAEWVHASRWRTSASIIRTEGSSRSAPALRGIELAHGATMAGDTGRVALDFSPTGWDRRAPLTIGIEARSLHFSAADAAALGDVARADTRLALNVGLRF